MIYFTVYIRNLHNSTGYVDVCLENDQLMTDYLQYLDIGVKAHKAYKLVSPGDARSNQGVFAINLDDIAAVTMMPPKH